MGTFWQKIKAFLNWLGDILEQIAGGDKYDPIPVPEPEPTRRERLLETAHYYLGKEASPKDIVDDELACVESLGNIIRRVAPFPDIYHTAEALKFFKGSKDWKGTLDLTPGNVILCATGTGNGTIRGHVGVILENGRIASNDSRTGLWTDYYTIDSWVARYRVKGGFTVYVFELL